MTSLDPVIIYRAQNTLKNISPALIRCWLGATPVLQVHQGGTGSSTLSGILYGNGTSSVRSVIIGANLAFSNGTLSATAGSGAAFPFDVNSWGNSTTSVLGFNNGFISNGSSTQVWSNIGSSTATTFAVPSLTSALLLTNGNGLFAEYAGTSCTNQFLRSLDALGAATCATVGTADVSGLDISDDTNLAATYPIILTGDTLSFQATSTFIVGALTSTSLNTGQGAYELYSMNQDVTTTSNVSFGTIGGTDGTLNSLAIDTNGIVFDTDGDGALSIQSNSAGSQEEIRVNLDDTANSAYWTSSTGVTAWLMDLIGISSNASSSFSWLNAASTTVSTKLALPYVASQILITDANGLVSGTTSPTSLAFTYASSTATAGTTTISKSGSPWGVTITSFGCVSTGGTVNVQMGDGSASTTMVTSATGNTTTFTALSSNNTFTTGERIYFAIGTFSGTGVTEVTCSNSQKKT
jgi:hypothetical protein